MAWPLTGSALTKYNRLLSDVRQYGDFPFVGSPDDITWLQEIIVAASDGVLRPPLDDVANRSHYWMLRTIALLGNLTIMPKPEPCPECPPVIPCPPCPPCPDCYSTTTPPGMENNFGIYAYSDIPGLTDVVINGTSVGEGIQIEFQSSLVSFSAPDLVTMSGDDFLALAFNSVLTSVSLPVFATLSSPAFLSVADHAALTSFSLPALISVDNGSYISVSNSPVLTTVSLGSATFVSGANLFFIANALTDTSVNHILARAVANAAYVSGTVNLSGGTNSAPTGQGIVDAADLVTRGVTVITN